MPDYSEVQLATIETVVGKAGVAVPVMGTCVYRDTTGAGATVMFDGSAGTVPAKCFAHVDAFAGDRVGLQLFGNDWVIVGSFTRRGPSEDGIFDFASAGTRNGSAYADMPGVSTCQFIKRYDSTRITATLLMTAYNSTVLSEASMGINIAGADYELAHYFFSTISERELIGGVRELSGIVAGTYTVTARWSRTSGTGTIDLSTLDLVTVRLVESSPPFTV